MKTLYIECNMGVAGDMLMGALLELTSDKERFIKKMNNLKIPGTTITSTDSIKCGIAGIHISVKINGEEEISEDEKHNHGHHIDELHEHHHEEGTYEHSHHSNADEVHEHSHEHSNSDGVHEYHHHASMEHIATIINNMNIEPKIKQDAIEIYHIIAEAESKVHQKPVSEIHFHEVGMSDAIADIVGNCILINEIAPERIIVSPIKTGYGQVRCAHGIIPVPAPATSFILKGIPNSTGNIEGELCTPTGAAIVKYFADAFEYQPEMIVSDIGYGMGNKDFAAANCVRTILGQTIDKAQQVVELCCNLDDMTSEQIGYATEVLMEQGALDVYTTSIGMKKSRPGIMLTAMCKKEDKDKIVKMIFKHTTTIGMREYVCNRKTLSTKLHKQDTKYGTVSIKTAQGYEVKKFKVEYEDLKRISKETGKSIIELKEELNKELE